MKRYTLHFRPTILPVPPEALKAELEKVLLRLHPRITYHMGSLYQRADGAMLVAIAVDGKRQLIESALKAATLSLPVRFEKLTWGWNTDNEAQLLLSASTPMETDPLAGVPPLDGEKEFHFRNRLMQGRYIALIISGLVLLLLLAVATAIRNTPFIEAIYLILFAVFIFALNDIPLDFRLYTTKVIVRHPEIELALWLLKKPACLPWVRVTGMDYTDPVCTLLFEGRKLRFLLSARFGCPDRDRILKTIIARAELSFVEGSFRKLSYRKPEAGCDPPGLDELRLSS